MNGINMLNVVSEWLSEFKLGIVNAFMKFVYGVYFAVVKAIAWVLDMLTQLFFIFAGMTNVSSTTVNAEGEAEKVDIVNFFLTQTSFQKAYLYLCLVALGLIIVFAIAKIIKQDYFDRNGPRSKGPIFRNIALSFIAFICIIPVFYFLIDIAGFLAMMVMQAMGYKGGGIGSMLFNISWADNGESIRTVAEGLPGSKVYDPDNFGWFANDTFYQYYWNPTEGVARTEIGSDLGIVEGGGAAGSVQDFYWYIFIFAGLILIVNLGDMMISMVTRMYKLIALFIVAPSPISQIVLDDGQKFKNWKDQVIQEALRVVGCVMCFMIFMMIASVVNDLDLMRYAFTNESASAISLLEGNALTSELSNSVTPLYYYGSKISWVDKAINALGKAMILIAGVGAIRDIDKVITPFLYGGKESMDDQKNSATRAAILGGAGAAATGALSLGKAAVGSAVSLANAGVGFIGRSIANGVGRGINTGRNIAGAGTGTPSGGSTPPGGGTGTPPAGAGGETPPTGDSGEGAARTPEGADMHPTLDDEDLDDIELSGGAKAGKGALGVAGGILSGATGIAFGIAGAALKNTGKVAKTALGTGLSTANIVAKTVASMTGMGKAYGAVEGAVGSMAKDVGGFVGGVAGKVKEGAKKAKDKIVQTGAMKAASKWHKDGGVINSALGSLSTVISGADKMRTADRNARAAVAEHGTRVADGFSAVTRTEATDAEVLAAATGMLEAGSHQMADAGALNASSQNITGRQNEAMVVDSDAVARINEEYAAAAAMSDEEYATLDRVEKAYADSGVAERNSAVDSYLADPENGRFKDNTRSARLNAIRCRMESLDRDYAGAISSFETARANGVAVDAKTLGQYHEYLQKSETLDNAYLYVEGGFGGKEGQGRASFESIKKELVKDKNYNSHQAWDKEKVRNGIRARAESATVMADMARNSRPTPGLVENDSNISAATRAQASFERMKAAKDNYEHAINAKDEKAISRRRAEVQNAAAAYSRHSAELQTHMGTTYDQTKKVSDENRTLNADYAEYYDTDRTKIAKNVDTMRANGASQKSIDKAQAKLDRYDDSRQKSYEDRKKIKASTSVGAGVQRVVTGVKAKNAERKNSRVTARNEAVARGRRRSGLDGTDSSDD